MKWPFKSRTPAAKPSEKISEVPKNSGIILNALGSVMMSSLASLEKGDVDLELLRARVADFYRDLSREPMNPDEFIQQAKALDSEAQRRLALATNGLSDGGARAAFTKAIGQAAAAEGVALLTSFARDLDLLTVTLLLESPLRREEFVRHFVARIGGVFHGESPTDSEDLLRRLDYRVLLAEAEKARLSAGDRMAYLKKLQQEQEQKLGRRSKI
jgi:hypothetical protein